MEKKFGADTAIQNIVIEMAQLGHGARGIVFGNRGSGVVGHFFNVTNQHGSVKFLDGQTGRPANLNNGYKSFRLLRIDE